ncbi:helix-turn-helix transcriptional regulator [Hymenobacter sp. BT523]|uniref:helix-turn-helix transcriptional regulator n=1 Tax=Hymenobacter sp. BT523 TaxID=2795725 RepID=UPI0018EAE523|nr:helix-turn-helix transcriptional regulator [Hymenobacter sp. BT523]MBJ6109375.1 helix-turn-helix transcriptional regulator [Hymenobacter sp. BT523]
MVAIPASETIDQRFAQLIQQFGLTKNSFAISLGKTASVVQHLIDGRNKPGYDLLCKVFEVYPNVSRDWLLLGRGPMLVGGEPIPKPTPQAVSPTVEAPLEPIDLTDIEAPASRRAGPGVAGSRLQPAEIAATLALASAAQQPVRVAAPALNEAIHSHQNAPAAAAEHPAAPAPQAAPAAEISSQPERRAASASPQPIAEPQVNPVAAPAAAPATNPEAFVAAALHAQHLQHQLAMAEMRNQHLLEQQQMLREMLAMARQAMV